MKMVKFISEIVFTNDLAKQQHAMHLINFEDAFFHHFLCPHDLCISRWGLFILMLMC